MMIGLRRHIQLSTHLRHIESIGQEGELDPAETHDQQTDITIVPQLMKHVNMTRSIIGASTF